MNTLHADDFGLRKILLVDDTQANRLVVKGLLKKRGFEVSEASNGEEAIASFQNDTPDLILMDVIMPGMDGYEATRRIRTMAGAQWVPIIFVSALDETHRLVEGLEAGGDDYLIKPLNPTILLAKLAAFSRTLSSQRAGDEARKKAEAIANNIIDGIIVIDEQGSIQTCNARAVKMFGYTQKELCGHNVNLLMPEPYHSAHDSFLLNRVNGGEPKIIGLAEREVLGKRKNGEIFPLELGITEIEVLGKRNFLGIVRDISVRKAAEKVILEQQVDLQRHLDEQRDEQTLAAELMMRQINRKSTRIKNIETWLVPANEFSGDVIASLETADGRIYALMGDATGHGLAAAVTVLPLLTLFYRMACQGQPLTEIVRDINTEMRVCLPTGRFIGAALVCLNTHTSTAEVWVGGVPDVLYISAETGEMKRIESWNFALGILDYSDADLQPITVKVSAGSQFVLYTDGVVEMSDQAGNLFGQEQLEATLCANKPENRLNAVKQIITTYLGDQPAQDDVSMLVITC
jgi:PAS domain S-box-containing protein